MPVARQYESGLRQRGTHLRSMREVLGYSVHSTDGEVGSVEDLIIEETLWGVHHVIVALQQPARSVVLPPESIRSISWPDKRVWVNLSRQEIANSPVFDPTKPVNHDIGHRLYDYYGRPVHVPSPAASEEVRQR